MKKYVWLILLVVILWGVFRVFGLAGNSMQVNAVQPTKSLQAQVTAQPTATRKPPTPTPTATIGFAATADYWRDQANNANIRANNSDGTAVALIALNVQATNDEAQRQHESEIAKNDKYIAELSLEEKILEMTATAKIPEMTQIAKEAEVKLGIIADEAMRVQATQTAENAQGELVLGIVGNCAIIMGGIVIVALVVFLFRIRKESEERHQQEEHEHEHEQQNDMLPSGEYIAGMWMPTLEEYVTREQIQMLAIGYFVRNKPLTHLMWTPAKENGFSENQFTQLQHVFTNQNFAEWLDETHKAGMRLTRAGEAFLMRFLPEKYHRTTPPPLEEGYEPLPPTYGQIDRQEKDDLPGGGVA